MTPQLQMIDERLMETMSRVRELCDVLVPAVLEDSGLSAAIEWALDDYKYRAGTPVRTHLEEVPGLSP